MSTPDRLSDRRAVLRLASLCLAWPVAAACAGCTRPVADHARLVERSQLAMGAELRLSVWTADEPAALAAFDAIAGEVDRLDALMSVWRDGSDVLRLNTAAGQAPVTVDPDVLDALRFARDAGDWTGGAFDVTFGALSDVWRFDHDQDNRVPARDEIAERLPLVDYRALEIDAAAGTAYLTRPGMRAHLGGIGKGYAVDRAAAMLRARGFRDYMIQFGGDLYASGRRGERPWRLGIGDPRGPAERFFAALDLSDAALSTSGDYERFFMRDGRRYHHILDPRSGEPAHGSRSVTIVAPQATTADALSTGVFVLGPDAGMTLIERLPGVEGVIVTSGNQVLVSSGLEERLEILAPPTEGP